VTAWLLLVRRDLRLALRQGGDAAMVIAFFVLAVTLFPLGVGPEPGVLQRIAPGIVWVTALLAALLSLERLFLADYEDGSLEALALMPLPLEAQVKLLRLIQHGEIERIGATTPKTVNVRIVAATNRNLAAMAEDGTFREDLYYRLAVVPLYLPPLRERKEDIPELIEHLFYRVKERHGMHNVRVSSSLTSYFIGHRWPGNVREMENVIERMLVLSNGEYISEDDLPEQLRDAPAINSASLLLELPENGISLEGVERELLLRALEKFKGNQTQAAHYLDISRRTLIYRMEKHGLRQDSDPG